MSKLPLVLLGGGRNDLVRKEWGFYLGNSINYRLQKNGLKTALVLSALSPEPRLFINLVEVDKVDTFLDYLASVDAQLICWLDEWFTESKGATD